jgi:ParB/RepB/Spo0J family partition protein
MTKKGDLRKFKDKFVPGKVKISECTNNTFQVRVKNFGVDIEDLKDSIQTTGLLQPIGVARSKFTADSDIYEWDIVWGQRRHYAMESLGYEEIDAYILDEELTEAEGKALSVIENIIRVNMQTKEIWNAVSQIYLEMGTGNMSKDAQLCAEKTGIPYTLIKDAIKVELIKNLKGGTKMYNYCQEKMISKTPALEILNVCRKADGVTIDEEKATEFIDYYAAQDNVLRTNTLKSAKQNPSGSVKSWIEGGKKFKENKPKVTKIELDTRSDEALSISADTDGVTKSEHAKLIVLEKLEQDGYL